MAEPLGHYEDTYMPHNTFSKETRTKYFVKEEINLPFSRNVCILEKVYIDPMPGRSKRENNIQTSGISVTAWFKYKKTSSVDFANSDGTIPQRPGLNISGGINSNQFFLKIDVIVIQHFLGQRFLGNFRYKYEVNEYLSQFINGLSEMGKADEVSFDFNIKLWDYYNSEYTELINVQSIDRIMKNPSGSIYTSCFNIEYHTSVS